MRTFVVAVCLASLCACREHPNTFDQYPQTDGGSGDGLLQEDLNNDPSQHPSQDSPAQDGCKPATAEALCKNAGKNCGEFVALDNCLTQRTVNCGSCSPTETCGAVVRNVCSSTQASCSEEDEAFCDRFGVDCGEFTQTDRCGIARTTNCGTCADPSTCGGGGTMNVCGQFCVPMDAIALCAKYGKDCGFFSGNDNCGTMQTLDCGTCAGPDTCGGSGQPNVCGKPDCVPKSDDLFCARYGKDCGDTSDEDICGDLRTANCGSCVGLKTCQDNVCVEPSCTPEADAMFCTRNAKQCDAFSGTDNCGHPRTANCGTCTASDSCQNNVCVPPSCAPETDAEFCTRNASQCDAFSGTDNCGNARSVYCGGCTAPQICQNNVCAEPSCLPESNTEFCSRQAKSCDTFTGTDNCGDSRSVYCGSCTAPQTCQNNVCSCTPETNAEFCDRQGKQCDTVSGTDNCGDARSVHCGSCAAPQTCGGGGTTGVCGSTGYTVTPASLDLGIHTNSTPTKALSIKNTGTATVVVVVTVHCTFNGRQMVQVSGGVSWSATATAFVSAGETKTVSVRTTDDGYPKFFGQDYDAKQAECYLDVSGSGQNATVATKGGLLTAGYTRLIRNLYLQFTGREPGAEGFEYWHSYIDSFTRRVFVSTFYNAVNADGNCVGMPFCLPDHTDCLTETTRIFKAFYEKPLDPYWEADCSGTLKNLDFHGRANVLGTAGGDAYWTTTWGAVWE